jgi:hypothetical protein
MMKIPIGLIIIIILIFCSLSGCISNENDKKIETEYSINFIENSYIVSETGYVNNNQTVTITKFINTTNLTEIVFNLIWTDDETGCFIVGDCIEMNIIPPDNLTVEFVPTNPSQSGDQFGNISITAKINSMPIDQKILKSEISKLIDNDGIGNWKINITCKYVTSDLMGLPDMGNDWELNIYIYYYEGNIL